MISTQMLTVLLGVSGLGFMFAPEVWKSVAGFFKKKPAQQLQGEVLSSEEPLVSMLFSLVEMRRFVASDPKAVEAIDTVLTPAIFKAGTEKHES